MAYQNIFVTRKTDAEPSTVYLWDDAEGLIVHPYREFEYSYKKDPTGKFISLYGDRLKKVKTIWPKEGEELFESDVPRETRVLTDLYLDTDDISTGHRILFFDIEVNTTNGYSLPMVADSNITAIANYNTVDNEYVVFLLDETGQMETVVQEHKETKLKETIIPLKTESELLDAWLDYYTKLQPTIITGWNSEGYDVPYTYNRLKRTKGAKIANSLSPIGIVQFSERYSTYRIAGVSHLDYMAMYKKFTYTQKPSYRLDAIGQDEVGMGKIQYDGTLDQLFRDDVNKFVDYNLQDVRIIVALDQKKKLIDQVRAICHAGHVPYEDFIASSRFIEGTILTYLHRKGIIAPNKPIGGREAFEQKQENDEEGFEGAYVKVPMPDLYEWVYSLDLQSLYPSIIMSVNISPETKYGKVTNWNVDAYMANELTILHVEIDDEVISMDRTTFVNMMSARGLNISSNGILYRTDKQGIIPEILDTWFKQRKEFKDLMKKYEKEGNTELATYYDQRQAVQKVFLNSIYGVLGLSTFRFYDLDNAFAVTATGQDVIKTSAKYINGQYKKAGVAPKTETWLKRYYEELIKDWKKPHNRHKPRPEYPSADDHCVYIDTDSVYFSAQPLLKDGENPKERTIQMARDMESGLNKFYDVMAKKLFFCDSHRFVIKGESVLETALWVAKKRYAMKKVYDLEVGMDVESTKPKIKGIDVVRSSFPKAFGKFMSEIIMDILNVVRKGDIDAKLLAFSEKIKTLSAFDIMKNTSVKTVTEIDDPTELSPTRFPKGAPAHFKAAIAYNRFLRARGLDQKYQTIRSGDKIKWTYLKDNPYQFETMAVKTYDDPPELLELVNTYIDHDMLFEKELANKLSDFYSALGWGEISTNVNQNAFEFFSFD
jgi:DNA polymerase elongation subunit (family B)